MPVTIRDIALHVGKSVTTVSRALNNFSDVAPETKQMIWDAARQLGYSPNTVAQRLQKQQSDTVGFIMPTSGPRFSDPFFSEFIAGIGNTAARLGYDLLVATRSAGESEVQSYRSIIGTGRADGVIVVRTRRSDARIDLLRERNFPFVVFGRTDGPLDYSFVDEDGVAGMAAVATHLHALGHRRIACITAPDNLMFSQYRMQGLRNAWTELGHALEDLLLVEGDLTQRGGYQSATLILDGSHKPTAIIACNDLMAFGAMAAVQERGFVIGVDISITGFDNIPMAEYSHPPLTSVDQPIYEIAGMLCEMLVRKIQDVDRPPEQVLLTPSLVVRQSTGVASQTPSWHPHLP